MYLYTPNEALRHRRPYVGGTGKVVAEPYLPFLDPTAALDVCRDPFCWFCWRTPACQDAAAPGPAQRSPLLSGHAPIHVHAPYLCFVPHPPPTPPRVCRSRTFPLSMRSTFMARAQSHPGPAQSWGRGGGGGSHRCPFCLSLQPGAGHSPFGSPPSQAQELKNELKNVPLPRRRDRPAALWRRYPPTTPPPPCSGEARPWPERLTLPFQGFFFLFFPLSGFGLGGVYLFISFPLLPSLQ